MSKRNINYSTRLSLKNRMVLAHKYNSIFKFGIKRSLELAHLFKDADSLNEELDKVNKLHVNNYSVLYVALFVTFIYFLMIFIL